MSEEVIENSSNSSSSSSTSSSIFPICNRCKLPVETPAYVLLLPSIVLQHFFSQTPPLFSCIEHAENYNHSLKLHDNCWIDMLKEHGVVLHDLKEVAKKYEQEKDIKRS